MFIYNYLYVKIFLSQSVSPLLNYTTIQSPLPSKCKFILKYLNLIFGIDFYGKSENIL